MRPSLGDAAGRLASMSNDSGAGQPYPSGMLLTRPSVPTCCAQPTPPPCSCGVNQPCPPPNYSPWVLKSGPFAGTPSFANGTVPGFVALDYDVDLSVFAGDDVLIVGAQAEYGCPMSGAVIVDNGGTANPTQKVRWTDPDLIWYLNEIAFYGGILSVNSQATWSSPPASSSLTILQFVIYFYDPVYYSG